MRNLPFGAVSPHADEGFLSSVCPHVGFQMVGPANILLNTRPYLFLLVHLVLFRVSPIVRIPRSFFLRIFSPEISCHIKKDKYNK